MLFKPKQQTISFSDIFRGLQYAINSVQEMLQAQQIQNIQGFFEENGKPISQTVRIGDKKIEVPLMSVVPHNSLVMDDVVIKFKAKVGAATAGRDAGLMSFGSSELTNANFEMQMDGISAKDSDAMEVTIRFKAKDAPESVARILDEYNKQI
ncbi:MAG: DUF2589 domain-containing protein [Tannerella sp.]|jgi:hypothetical protein|nr:DUF2589 domain-containing protein [Tannerella sp.]